jgi:hypothetical protein
MPNIILRPGATNPSDVILYDPTAQGTNYANSSLLNVDSVLLATGGLTVGGIATLVNNNSVLQASGSELIIGIFDSVNDSSILSATGKVSNDGNAILVSDDAVLVGSGSVDVVGNSEIISTVSILSVSGTVTAIPVITVNANLFSQDSLLQVDGVVGDGKRKPVTYGGLAFQPREEDEEEIVALLAYYLNER